MDQSRQRDTGGWGWESLPGLLPPYVSFILDVMVLLAPPAALQHIVPCAGALGQGTRREVETSGERRLGKERPSTAGPAQALEFAREAAGGSCRGWYLRCTVDISVLGPHRRETTVLFVGASALHPFKGPKES